MASVSAFCYTGAQPVDILKIATFNINGIRSRLPALLEWLEREGPDVVCLQELKAPDAAFPINDIHAAGYGAIWHGQASWNGVAILAKGSSTPNWRHDSAVPASIAGSATGPAQATTRRPGSSWIWARRRKERNGSAARSSGPTLRQRLPLGRHSR